MNCIEATATCCAGWSHTSQKPVQPTNHVSARRKTPVVHASHREPVNFFAMNMRAAWMNSRSMTRSEL